MKVFLTGGTGFIGQPLARALLGRGWEVAALVRKPDGAPARTLEAMGARIVPGDVTDRESLRAAMAGTELVIHNAGHYEFGLDAAGQARMEAINVLGTDNVLGLARELGVPRAVYVSSVVAYGDTGQRVCDERYERCVPSTSVYEQTKTDAHQIALNHGAYGLPLVLACPNAVVGPNDHSPWGYFLRLYLNKLMPPVAWAADQVQSLVEVNDLVRGLALAAEKGRPGETYIFAGETKTRREHLAYWFRHTGRFRTRAWLPNQVAAPSFRVLEPFQRAVGLPAFISHETVIGTSSNFNFTSVKAQRELGWSLMSAAEMWERTIDGELALLEKRTKRDLVSRLRPLETLEA